MICPSCGDEMEYFPADSEGDSEWATYVPACWSCPECDLTLPPEDDCEP